MDSDASFRRNSILEQVKAQIPTINLDSSTSETEEMIIYQRPAGLSLRIPEDSDSFSIDSAYVELMKPVAQTCLSEESCTLRMTLDDEKTLESTSWVQLGEKHHDDVVKAPATVDLNVTQSDISVGRNMDSKKSYEDYPVLSLRKLDQWDLDNVLQHLKKHELSHHCVSADIVKTHATLTRVLHVEDEKDKHIMEKLISFWKSHSPEPKPVKSPNPIRKSNLRNALLEKMSAKLKQNHQECPTVFIDLRCPDLLIKPPRIHPGLSSKSIPPAKDNIQQGGQCAKTASPKVASASLINNRELTGKSMLLQKIREKNRNGNTSPNKYTNAPDAVRGEGELGNEAKKSKEKPLQPSEPTSGHNSQTLWEDNQSLVLKSEGRKPKMENLQTSEQSSLRESKQQRDQQRKKLKQTLQHKEHQEILERLEAHRPTKSVHQKQPAAESTNILYDLEASHLQSISILPEKVTSHDNLLLIVNLSSPGVVEAHGKRKHLFPAATKSHIYNTLVSWFLSLVGPDLNPDVANVPFWVAGLQQLWTEDGLALHVLAVAHHCYTLRKRDKEIHAPFYNHVCRFLSETTLTQIAHWLPELQIFLDKQALVPLIHLPSLTLNCFVSASSNKKVLERTFCLSPGFYWQTVETQECVCNMRETSEELHTEVSYALGCNGLFLHPLITHSTLQLVSDAGLDVCGLRLLYPRQRVLTDCVGSAAGDWKDAETCQPVFVLAVRGPRAFLKFKHLTSSLHPLLPKRADTTFSSPLQSSNQRTPLLYLPQLASQVHKELCLWFAGRLTGENAQINTQLQNRISSIGGDRCSLLNSCRSSALLCATTKADTLLVASPAVPSCCYGLVLAVCESRGFSLKGLQLLQLQSKGAGLLRLTTQQAAAFCGSPTVPPSQRDLELPSQCLVLLLRKENAMHHSVGLPAALVRELNAENLLGCISSGHDGIQTVEPRFCFHTVPYSRKLYQTFVKCMWTVPEPSTVILSKQKCMCNYDMEQVVILTLCGKDMSHGLSLLHQMLTEEPEGDATRARLKLLGIKWLPVLTQLQAQELSPYEVGEQHFQNSLDILMSFPVLVCALRGKDTFGSLRKLLPHNYPGNLSVLMSATPQVAFRQASLFFEDGTINDPQMLLTVCLCKPGAWKNSLHKILQKLQESGLMVVGMRVVVLDKHDAASLLPTESDPSEVEAHVKYLCSGSSVALCLQGNNAAKRLQDMLCRDDSSLWTNCYDTAHFFTGVYGSGSNEKAIRDVKRFFPHGLCCSTVTQEQIFNISSDPLASVEREQTCTLVSESQRSSSGPNGGFLIHSTLCQTTCLLVPATAPGLSQVASQLEMLLRSGCHLVAGRMTRSLVR